MRLYYGSNVEVRNPKIINSTRSLDFGSGFYLTSDLEQAKRWAKTKSERLKEGYPIVSVFDFEVNSNLKFLEFKSADEKWLRFVAKNRKKELIEENFDVIKGPIANDSTMPVLQLYLTGQYDEEEAIRRLLPQNLKDQFVFKTEDSLKYLRFVEVIKE